MESIMGLPLIETWKACREKAQCEHAHSDLCSLNKPHYTLTSARYVLIFIDDFSQVYDL
jgi:hypothetical protein